MPRRGKKAVHFQPTLYIEQWNEAVFSNWRLFNSFQRFSMLGVVIIISIIAIIIRHPHSQQHSHMCALPFFRLLTIIVRT